MKKWMKATAIVLALMGLSMKNAYAIDTTTVNENGKTNRGLWWWTQ